MTEQPESAEQIAQQAVHLAVKLGAKSVIVIVGTETDSTYNIHGFQDGLTAIWKKYARRVQQRILNPPNVA